MKQPPLKTKALLLALLVVLVGPGVNLLLSPVVVDKMTSFTYPAYRNLLCPTETEFNARCKSVFYPTSVLKTRLALTLRLHLL
jgi:hypothetical protein